MNPNNLKGPLIHLNGTSATDLEAQMRVCCDALRAAMNALYQASPNARDYYPLGDEAFAEAKSRHERWTSSVVSVFNGCQEIMREIQKQIDDRAK